MNGKELFTKSVSAAASTTPSVEQVEKEFDATIQELDALCKAMSCGDDMEGKDGDEMVDPKDPKKKKKKAVEAAAEASEKAEGEGEEEIEDEHLPMVTKSLVIDGEHLEVQLLDGAKEFFQLQDTLSGLSKTFSKSISAQNSGLATLAKAIKAQGEFLKSLAAEVSEIGNTGKPRKSVVSIIPRNTDDSTTTPAQNGQEIVAKALAASQAGKISALDVAEIDGHVRAGKPVPSGLLKKIE